MPTPSVASSVTSTPVWNARPSPVCTITRTSGSRSSSIHASPNSSRIAPFMALSCSGRLLISQPTGPCRSTNRCSYGISDPSLGSEVGVDPRRRAPLLERPVSLDRLLTPEAVAHADAVVEAVVGIQLTLDVAAGAGRGAAALGEHLGCGIEQLIVGHKAGDQPPVDRFFGRQLPPREHEIAGTGRSDVAGEDVAV